MIGNTSPGAPKIAIVGGSLGGLFAAVALSQAGCKVDVYERSTSSLGDKGAGLRMQADMVARLEKAGINVDTSAVSPMHFRYLGAGDSILHEEPTDILYTSWERLYYLLINAIGKEHYHTGKYAKGIRQQPGHVTVDFADGSSVDADLLVGADGLTSSVRQWLAPTEVPHYAGYVCWRGMALEGDISASARRLLSDAGTYVLLKPGHMATYPIPGKDGSIAEGSRAYNFVWYRNLPVADLPALMVDRAGEQRSWSLPAGGVKLSDLAQLREAAVRELPPAAAEVIVRTDEPFIQVVVDVEVSRMVHGRACLMGDAAFSGRPHLGAGTAKAAADAWTLAAEIAASPGSIDAALARWEARQLTLGQRYVQANRQLGYELQVAGSIRPHEFSSRLGWPALIRELA